ncbi:pyridoxamine 5'-phosphate oxidase family protein [Parafrankia sp. BMG5.11]|nr:MULTISPECIES: pyridoxamine 5'-phosphate oxidase family protein [unclassified Parafrankia]TCJ31302.1 pyridoxamine 5'-phosphate oxidase family protein [Parafrankia sp. BMG5.11]SQD96689.1 conserved hypothetical protein [Parafrankia sp. Ea1.12]
MIGLTVPEIRKLIATLDRGAAPGQDLNRCDTKPGALLRSYRTPNMCVLATSGPQGPLATPVRYYHLDFAVMFTASLTSPKMRNIAADPRVSLGVFAPLVGQASSRGAQIFGRARVLAAEESEFGY